MNIIKMYESAWTQPHIKYVGYNKYALGLANPWAHSLKMTQARFFVETKKEALYRYKEWLFTKLIPSLNVPGGFAFLEDWEKQYLFKMIGLTQSIQLGETKTLGCWCCNILNYSANDTEPEQCHAQILYKACMKLIEDGKV